MIHNITHYTLPDQIRIFSQSWQPENEPKAIICLVHGIGEHSSRYHLWAERFVSKNYAVVSFDQRGHGLSDGKRGLIPSYEKLMDDIDWMLDKVNELFPEKAVFLYGHSMGGGEVLNHLICRKPNYLGVISTSPWIVSQAAPSKVVIPIVRFLYKLIPSFRIKTVFDSNTLSHNKEVVKKYDEDELVHPMVSFRLFVEAYDAGYRVLNNSEKVNKPLLLLHGGEDKITDPKASAKFSKAASSFCTYKEYAEGYHELHNDFCHDEVFSDIVEWLECRLKETI